MFPSKRKSSESGKFEPAKLGEHDSLDVPDAPRTIQIQCRQPIANLQQVGFVVIEERRQKPIELSQLSAFTAKANSVKLLSHPRPETSPHLDIPDRVKITEVEIGKTTCIGHDICPTKDDQAGSPWC